MVIALLLLPLLLLVVRRAVHRHRERSLAARRQAGTVQALQAVTLAMRSGAAPDEALRGAADGFGDLLPWLVGLAAGADLGADAPPLIRALAVAVDLSGRTGTSLATLTDRLIDSAQAELAARRELSDGLAATRSSAVVLAGLPVAGVACGELLGAHPLAFLAGGSAAGTACLLGGCGLAWVGHLWTGRLVAAALDRVTG